jgi:peptidoglycan-associated lipoprotein
MRLSHYLTVLPVCIMLAIAGGCSKKQTKVEVPEPVEQAPVPDTTPTTPPVQEPVEPAFDAATSLQTVYFDYDQSNLKPDGIARLEIIGKMMLEHQNVKIMIEGHADERGSSEYNMGLGESRANSVKRWLVNYGVADSRLETVSYGKERPVNANCGEDDSCHALNRRVEFRVTMQ